MFFYIKANNGTFINYDTTFEAFATIDYRLVKGGVITKGKVSQCSSTTYAKFLSLPELAGVP
jgi:hypothetical protein